MIYYFKSNATKKLAMYKLLVFCIIPYILEILIPFNEKIINNIKDIIIIIRSKPILQGTIQESAKSDPCDKCH